MPVALFGRGPQTDVLTALIDGARVGRGGAVLVRGAAGIGKSALLASGETRASAAGFTVVSVFGEPAGSDVPYAGLPYTPQQYQTVTASPANNAVITPFANAGVTYRENLAYAPDAITLVVAPLWIPPNEKGVIAAARHNYDSLSMRSLVCYEPTTDQPIDRLDILFGSGVPRPEWLTQVCDAVP